MTDQTKFGGISFAQIGTVGDDGHPIPGRRSANNREHRNPVNIQRYAQIMLAAHDAGLDNPFPPAKATRWQPEEGEAVVFDYDGRHRIIAHKDMLLALAEKAGQSSTESTEAAHEEPYPCEFIDCDSEVSAYTKALLLAAQSDATHGVQLTKGDVAFHFGLLVDDKAIDPTDYGQVSEVTGCSLRYAQELTRPYRTAQTETRDSAIKATLSEGLSVRKTAEKHGVSNGLVSKLRKEISSVHVARSAENEHPQNHRETEPTRSIHNASGEILHVDEKANSQSTSTTNQPSNGCGQSGHIDQKTTSLNSSEVGQAAGGGYSKGTEKRNKTGEVEVRYDLRGALNAYPKAANDLLGDFVDMPPDEWTASLPDLMAIEDVAATVALAQESHNKAGEFLAMLADHLKAKAEAA